MKRFLSLFIFTLLTFVPTQFLWAGNENQDFMRSIGKIYVVVGVIVATFVGIAVYMFILDGKITKLERQVKVKKFD